MRGRPRRVFARLRSTGPTGAWSGVRLLSSMGMSDRVRTYCGEDRSVLRGFPVLRGAHRAVRLRLDPVLLPGVAPAGTGARLRRGGVLRDRPRRQGAAPPAAATAARRRPAGPRVPGAADRHVRPDAGSPTRLTDGLARSVEACSRAADLYYPWCRVTQRPHEISGPHVFVNPTGIRYGDTATPIRRPMSLPRGDQHG